MPSSHRRYADWSPERLRRWAATVGPSTEGLIIAILANRPHPEHGSGPVSVCCACSAISSRPRPKPRSATGTQPVISVAPNDTIERAVRLMLEKQVSGLPVIVASGLLVGMVAEGDFLRRAEIAARTHRARWLEFLIGAVRLADKYVHTHGRKVSEVMTSEPATVTEDTILEDVVKLMEKRRIKRVPVVRGERVVGIVSRANLLRALVAVWAETRPTIVSDQTIREQLLAELGKEKWAPIGSIDVIVRDGIVDFWGTIIDEKERQALIVAPENIPGVKGVRNHLTWVDPMSGMVFLPPNEAAKNPRPIS